MTETVNVAVVGCGYWGPNLIRNFYQLLGARLLTVCDLKEDRLDYARKHFPGVGVSNDVGSILAHPDIDAVVLTTQADSHYRLASEALEAGKHVLVEKPLAQTAAECLKLIDLAASKNRVLMVGHTFLYNAAVRKLKEFMANGELGEIYYLSSSRLNLGRIRSDINAMWNFAPHDVSIILYLLDKKPVAVSAKGRSYIQPHIEDVVFMHLDFANGISANIHISWLDPNKVRKMTVVGSKKMVVYDDVSPDAKITVYDKGIDKINISNSLGDFETFGEFQLRLRAGDMHVPRIEFVEPLKMECAHFIDCIKNNKRPLTDGEEGYWVVRILEAGQRSMDKGGVPIEIEWERGG
ncbi:Gfo/Idh/MocA family oxidoreductase [candidate division KSB1 bacterium]|nr:Gfo/Idh/MocA family oxidoreductase [candidate division KSB1 bacterium]